MKRIFTFLFLLILAKSLYAQAPEKMNYQAVIRDGDGDLIAEKEVGVRIRILKDSEFGGAVFVETHTVQTNANGLVSLHIGDGEAVEGTLADIEWAEGVYFIQTETDPNGGTNYSITGTSQLLSVPYALYSKKSGDSLFVEKGDVIYSNRKVGIGMNEPEEQLHVDGNVKSNGSISASDEVKAGRLIINPDRSEGNSFIVFGSEDHTEAPRMFFSESTQRLYFEDMEGVKVSSDLDIEGDVQATGDIHARGFKVEGELEAEGNVNSGNNLIAHRKVKAGVSVSGEHFYVNPKGNGQFSHVVFRSDTSMDSPRMFHSSMDDRIHFRDISGIRLQGGLDVDEGGVSGEGDFTTTGHLFINTDASSNIGYVIFRGTTPINNPRMFYREDHDRLAFSGAGEVAVDGDFLATGTKNFIQDHPSDPSKQIRYTALEAGEAGTYWRGSARTENGRVEIDLPEHFGLVTSEEGLTVNLTPRGGWAPLYVEEVSLTNLIIKLDDRFSDGDVEFDFMINGIRLGYENVEVIEDKKSIGED
ncbi:hypothetical protein RCC89_16225 [Cytophagaceae bacterium ABcell3]|nr:hypothetical protein RCC89_16225 [Cytophagaceae bacterium ABcell3]